MTNLLTIEEAVKRRLDLVVVRQRAEELQRKEEEARIEAGRVEFAEALADHIRANYHLADILPFVYYHGGAAYMFKMPLEAHPLENTIVHATIETRYALSAQTLRDGGFGWDGLRKYKAADAADADSPETYHDWERHQTSDLIEAITFGVTGQKVSA